MGYSPWGHKDLDTTERLHLHLPCIISLSSWSLQHLSSSWICPSRITALSWRRGLHNSVKRRAMPCRATQDGRVIAESSDKIWYPGGGNGKPPQYTCHENLMNYMKDQNDNLCLMWYLKVNQDHYWCLPGKHWYVKTRCIRYVFQAETCRRVSTFCSGILAVLPASLLSDIPSSVSASAVRSMGLWLQLIETHPLSCLSFSHFIMNFSYLKQNQKPFCNFTFPTPLN